MLAKISGVFRLTRDAELRYTASGVAILKVGLACSEKYKDKETQLFIDGTAFGKSGELINQYAGSKGTQIFIAGKLQTDMWEKDGQKQSKISIQIEDFQFLGSNGSQQGGNYTQRGTQQGNAPKQRQAPVYEYQNASGQTTPPPQRQAEQPQAIDIDINEVPF